MTRIPLDLDGDPFSNSFSSHSLPIILFPFFIIISTLELLELKSGLRRYNTVLLSPLS